VTSNLTDTTDADTAITNTALTYTATAAYKVGVNEDGTNSVGDKNTTAANVTFAADTSSTGNIATISYADAAGESLNGTDLSNATDAQTALTGLNSAITDVAAQDGYIGAQINTLNAVSQVLSTQQENVQSAQNAVQATDYASATSNMSKYEILSQTGIAALAQANSMQQEVTKLLQ
jgi:flagellin